MEHELGNACSVGGIGATACVENGVNGLPQSSGGGGAGGLKQRPWRPVAATTFPGQRGSFGGQYLTGARRHAEEGGVGGSGGRVKQSQQVSQRFRKHQPKFERAI